MSWILLAALALAAPVPAVHGSLSTAMLSSEQPVGLDPVDRLEAAHHRASELLVFGDFEGAVDLVRAPLLTPPPCGPPQGPSYLVRASWFGPAPPHAHTVLPVEPETTALLFDTAHLFLAAGEPRPAVHLLEAVVQAAPDHRHAHDLLVVGRCALGDRADARRHAALRDGEESRLASVPCDRALLGDLRH